ncbi:MAG: hypothetical protein WD021_09350 [Rhodothermales bacterium]
MKKIGLKGWMMAASWLLVSAVGAYYTFSYQPKQLERLEKAEQVATMKHAELISLETEQTALEQMADNAVRKWRARYKVIPKELSTADVVGYLNDLTAGGFKNFDITYAGEHRSPDYAYYAFEVTGRAYYNSLYRLVWELENNRHFYRVHDLSLDHIDLVTQDRVRGTDRLDVMVSFRGRIEAYFDGIEGASAPDRLDAASYEEPSLAIRGNDALPPVPLDVLPDVQPAANPFYPAVLEQIPPNTYDRIDIESAQLVSIVGDRAVFQEDGEVRSVRIGERVYLGQVIEVDPATGRVVARLNKGGIIDEIVKSIGPDASYRQAVGPASLTPSN